MGVFVNRRRPIFNVHLDIMIDDKPQRIKARVALSDEENWDSINDINSIARWFGRQKPFQIGQILAIEYDYTNPKRGNIILHMQILSKYCKKHLTYL
ncbi:MAG: hypothetical protein FWE01_01180 [Firmicutes bacterium]|nr:hypothetical protein [Bacillota bacterium]